MTRNEALTNAKFKAIRHNKPVVLIKDASGLLATVSGRGHEYLAILLEDWEDRCALDGAYEMPLHYFNRCPGIIVP